MPITPPFHPIVYVRGFAATRGEIEDTVATPYMGFNLGATKIRQDHEGDIVRFVFESPLIRLRKDHKYEDTYRDGDLWPEDEQVETQSIWIFRYYEQASEDLGTGKRQTIPQIAADLRRFILRIRNMVCEDDAAARRAFRVHLVAHSMGGLVCRCYLQNLCVNGAGDAQSDRELELTDRRRNAAGFIDDHVHLVDKVFTYATPHNGIDLAGVNAPNLSGLDGFHVRNFNRKVMHEYLALPGRWKRDEPVNSLNGTFPVDRFFCLVGTNHRDYTAFHGMSRVLAGPISDGLVQISSATVRDAPRAFVHRSHSGHYGVVNSEEGYQNLRRFLFGDVRVDALLHADEITFPDAVVDQARGDLGRVEASYHVEATARVRGSICYLHDRRVVNASAQFAQWDSPGVVSVETERRVVTPQNDRRHGDRPIYLFSGYLLKSAKTEDTGDTALAFAIRVAVAIPSYEIDKRFWFNAHFEGGALLDETITFFVRTQGDETTVSHGLQSVHGIGRAPSRRPIEQIDGGERRLLIPLGFREGVRNPPRPGFRGRLEFRLRPWNT